MAQAQEGQHGIVKAGFLRSKREYWVALSSRDRAMYYFVSRDQPRPEGRIPLADSELKLVVDEAAQHYGFCIRTSKGSDFTLLAKDRETANGWLKVLYENVGARWIPEESELADFGSQFDRARNGAASVDGARAREVFKASGLAPEILGKIWALADRDKDKQLNRQEFMLAMALVRGKKRGLALPSQVPYSLLATIYPDTTDHGPLLPLSASTASSLRAAGVGDVNGAPSTPEPQRNSLTEDVDGAKASLNVMQYGAMPDPAAAKSVRALEQSGKIGAKTPYGPLHIPANALASAKDASLLPAAFGPGIRRSVDEHGANVAYAVPIHIDQRSIPSNDLYDLPHADEILMYRSSRSVSAGSDAGSLAEPRSDELIQSSASHSPRSRPRQEPMDDPSATAWVECTAPDGKIFYYNNLTQETRWDLPSSGKAELDSGAISRIQVSERRHVRQQSIDALGGLPLPLSSTLRFESEGHHLLNTLADPARFDFFRDFLDREGHNADLLFYVDTASWRAKLPATGHPMPSDVAAAREIFETYISTRSVKVPAVTVSSPNICVSCSQPVKKGEGTTLDERTWHRHCFICCICKLAFSDDSRVALKGKRIFHAECKQQESESAADTDDSAVSSQVAVTSAHSFSGKPKIAISSSVKAELKSQLVKAGRETNPTLLLPNIFEPARSEVLKRMQSQQFPRFMKSIFYIAMFNSISSQSRYDLPQELWDEFIEASDGGEDQGWKSEGNIKGVCVETKRFSGDPLTYVRGTSVIPLAADECYKFAVSTDLRKLWDMNMVEAKILQRLDDRTVIFYVNYRPPRWASFMNNHDFVVLRTERRLADGTILVLSRSVVHHDAPERKGHNRGEMHCGGFCLRPSTKNKTTMIYINQVEMHGIPQWAEKKYVLKRALIVKTIRSYVEKQLKKEKQKGTKPSWTSPQIDVNRVLARQSSQRRQSSQTSDDVLAGST